MHRAFLTAVPYEDLAVQLGECGPLDGAALRERVLAGGRGGYCFEVNTVLCDLLRELGFTVARRQAVVGPPGDPSPTNHLALVVDLGADGRWVADAGWGEAFLEPLALRAGRHVQGALHWDVEELADGGWYVHQHEHGSTPGFRLGADDHELDAFAPHHARLSTDPASPFVQTLVVQLPGPDRITTLRSRTLSVDGPGLRERRLLATQDELEDVLHGVFGIDPRALGADRMALLWRAAGVQHERWSAATA